MTLSLTYFFLSPGKWHLGLNCRSHDDHCHHPRVHGFNYFFGIPLTNLRDCQPGHGTVFQFQKYLPYGTFGLVLFTVVTLHYSRVITVSRRQILGLLFLLMLATALTAGFIKMVPYFNCILFRDHSIVEQPFIAENLTQTMTREAVGFIERYLSLFPIFLGPDPLERSLFYGSDFLDYL